MRKRKYELDPFFSQNTNAAATAALRTSKSRQSATPVFPLTDLSSAVGTVCGVQTGIDRKLQQTTLLTALT
jgi:hypothetical protein